MEEEYYSRHCRDLLIFREQCINRSLCLHYHLQRGVWDLLGSCFRFNLLSKPSLWIRYVGKGNSSITETDSGFFSRFPPSSTDVLKDRSTPSNIVINDNGMDLRVTDCGYELMFYSFWPV